MAFSPNSQLRAGDSMTRQIFLRLVGMFRGQQRSFDYGPHNSARYDVCGGAHPADRSGAIPIRGP